MTPERKSYEQLKQELKEAADKVQVGVSYAHYKLPQLPYRVTGLAVMEASNEVAVLYQPLHEPDVTFVRPVSAWLETVEHNGQTLPRFTKLA